MSNYQPKIRKFSRDENPIQWLKDYISKIEGAGGLNNLKHVYFYQCFKGAASDWYCNVLEYKPKLYWDLLQAAFSACWKPVAFDVCAVEVLPNLTPPGKNCQPPATSIQPTADRMVEDAKEVEEDQKSEKEVMKEEHIVTKQTDEDSTQSASLMFNWVTDIDASIGYVPVMFVNINPTPIDTPTPVELIPAISISQSSPCLSTSAPIVHCLRGLSGLRSGVQNPWGSLHHCNHRSCPPSVHRMYSHPEPIWYSHLHQPHPEPL
jgi:hypothetical protein